MALLGIYIATKQDTEQKVHGFLKLQTGRSQNWESMQEHLLNTLKSNK